MTDNGTYPEPERAVCECEHARHLNDGHAGAYEPGHAYGEHQAAVVTYKTEFGRYDLCHWCWEVCHDSIYPVSEIQRVHR